MSNEELEKTLFNRIMSPYEAEQARVYKKALGMIKPVEEVNGSFEGWVFRRITYSDGSMEFASFEKKLK